MKNTSPTAKTHGPVTRGWAILLVTFLIVVIAVLAFMSMFGLGPLSEWKIKLGEIEASGSSLGFGFAVLIFLVFAMVWSDFKQVIFELNRVIELAAKSLRHHNQ